MVSPSSCWGFMTGSIIVYRSIQDFVLTRQLYRGKASTLYVAACRQSGTPVVIKSYSKRRLSQLNWYQVEREIRLHVSFKHENIINLHAAFEDQDHVFLVQEYATGMPVALQQSGNCTHARTAHFWMLWSVKLRIAESVSYLAGVRFDDQ